MVGPTRVDTYSQKRKVKRMASNPAVQGEGSAMMAKLSILGALSLNLDFFNLFIFLLRIGSVHQANAEKAVSMAYEQEIIANSDV